MTSHQFTPQQLRAQAEYLREDVETDAKTLSRLHWIAEGLDFAATAIEEAAAKADRLTRSLRDVHEQKDRRINELIQRLQGLREQP